MRPGSGPHDQLRGLGRIVLWDPLESSRGQRVLTDISRSWPRNDASQGAKAYLQQSKNVLKQAKRVYQEEA